MKRVIDGNFIVQQEDAYWIQHIPTTMVQNTHPPFFLDYGPKTAQSLTPMTMKFRKPHSSKSMSCE